MISQVDLGSRGLPLQPGWVNVFCSCEQKLFFLTMPLSTHEYKWVPEISQENLMKC